MRMVPVRSSPVLLGEMLMTDSLIPCPPREGSIVNQPSPSRLQSQVAKIVTALVEPSAGCVWRTVLITAVS